MNMRPKALHLFAAALLTAAAAMAAPFPDQVSFESQVEDSAGLALQGVFDMEFRYYDAAGQELLSERHSEVRVSDGRFEVELGTGQLSSTGYDSLGAVFATHPGVEVEVTVGGVTQSPRVGILPAGHSLKSRLVAAGVRSEDDGEAHWKHYEARSDATGVQAVILAPAGSPFRSNQAQSEQQKFNPYLYEMEGPLASLPVRDLPVVEATTPMQEAEEINLPRHEEIFDEDGYRFGTRAPTQPDPLAELSGSYTPERQTPALLVDFEGIGNINGVLPPDTEGAVGPNHYVQVVNLSFAVYDKAGNLLSGPFNTSSLWTGFGGPCETLNNGDAIFLYDQPADRWVFSQFAVASGNQDVCLAVSQTGDPTGAFWLYSVTTPRFPDYYKLGVWPDRDNSAYFMGTNTGFGGEYDIAALDRDNLLSGAAARPMQVFQDHPNLLMPADVDGPNLPPAGSPGIFYTFRDGGEPYFGNPPTDSLDIWEFDVDWDTPAASTFTLVQSLTPTQGLIDFNWTVCGFFQSACLPQPGSGACNSFINEDCLDSASWWPMQRLQYRNFGTHETLVGTWTVDTTASTPRDGHAAPRWFELRKTTDAWSFYQQGTHAPDGDDRWMPSIAMDGGGNIAIGYSKVNDSSVFPSIFYATRAAGDALGTLQSEALHIAGGGIQTHSANRLGDYSSMDVDPLDDCTFWFTTEYIQSTGNAPWKTRVGAFQVPECIAAVVFKDGFESGDLSSWSSSTP
jgi:hypothetical protein